jgi:hypothetical protein
MPKAISKNRRASTSRKPASLIPHITDMRDGTFRPEVVIDDGKGGDIIFLEPMATVDAAWDRACDEIELTSGEWSDDGRRYVCAEPPNPRKDRLRRKMELAVTNAVKAARRYAAAA